MDPIFEDNSIRINSSETEVPIKMENFSATDNNMHHAGGMESINATFSRMSVLGQTNGNSGEMPPPNSDIGDPLNFNINGSDIFEDHDSGSFNFYPGGSRSDAWSGGNSQYPGTAVNDTFDFLVKSLLSANNFVSLLNREQVEVLRSIRPSLLCALLQEVAKFRADRRMRRALPHECAFCKNNGENEEHYSSHALKDGRGRVLCPVLRAFRCPRCGATGDRAHTIKYCPENLETASDRSGSLSWRRRTSSSSFMGQQSTSTGRPLFSQTPTPTPSPSPSPLSMPSTSMWTCFGME